MTAKKILVVDDEKDLVELIAFNLEQEGYTVFKAWDGEKAMELALAIKPDLLVLDLMLPGMSGLDICRSIRGKAETEHLPIVMVTAKGQDVDKIIGLELGADDYITKPFSVRELVARIRAVLRRSERQLTPEEEDVFTFRALQVNYSSYEVRLDDRKVELGPKEMKLLIFFTKHPGRVYSRDQLLDYVWGDETYVEPRTVDVHISRLRTMVEKDKENPEYILTVWGIGYKFADVKAP